MKRLIIVSALAVAAMPVMAWQRSEADMLKIARENLQLRVGTAVVKKALEKEMLTVYTGENSGYVIVSRSGSTSSVIGYSEGIFEAQSLPDGLVWWLDKANENIMAAENFNVTAGSRVKAVAPMLTTYWAQESPYNQLCPKVGGGFWGTTTPMTGCVATAMAQVMNYFKYPAQSVGTGSYSTDGQNYQTVKMGTTYKWDKMRNAYNVGYTQEEATAVEELMRDCGYASNMVYTAQGSGTTIYEGAYGLCKNMQYDPYSLRVRTRAYYRADDWMKMIYAELESERPILYMAVDPDQLGHAFVFDGVDEQGLVHVNWGWSGTANGYYDVYAVNGLNPSYQEPYYGTTIKYNFYDEQAMVIGFKPQATPGPEEKYESTFVTYQEPQIAIDNDVIYVSQIPLFNYGHLPFNGLLGLVVQGEDGHAVVLPFFYSAWEDNLEIPVLGGIYFTEEYYPQGTLNESDMSTPRPDGKYTLYFVSWASQEMEQGTNPQYIRYPIALAPDGAENYCVWEANIVNGHWDAASLKAVEIEAAGIEELVAPITHDCLTKVYGIDGTLIYQGENPQDAVERGVPVIVVKDGKAEKVIF